MYSFLLEVESSPGPGAAGRIMSMTNSKDTIGNRTRDLRACNAVSQLRYCEPDNKGYTHKLKRL